ncbi:putative lrr receptor-like serine/threonine-protein kinase [Quercus suber]|uniref:Lrr receptor-like serine/threonine-protein kinase n=1 Tax=Quercus suber TaxID=58331 RepID=A0AAW0LAV7_QUESU|nr:isoform 2 of probable lrr receptor-like serine/threonine-protein kinase [Quercus suber]
MELVDLELGSDLSKEEALRMIKVALLCTNPSPVLRTVMTTVVNMLEGRIVIDELTRGPSIYGDEWGFEALRDQYGDSSRPNSMESQSFIQSSNATWIGSSSTSAHNICSTNQND